MSRKRKLSFDTERAMALYADGHTDTEIAEQVGVNRTTITRWRQRSGLAANKNGRL